MLFLALLTLKSFALAVAAILALRIARARSAAVRSMIAHLGLLALVLLPLVSIAAPELPLRMPAEIAPVAAVMSQPLLPASPPAFQHGQPSRAPAKSETTAAAFRPYAIFVTCVVLVPAGLLLALMLLSVWQLVGLRRRADVLTDVIWLNALAQAQKRIGCKSGTALLRSAELNSPVSWGLMRPTIVLDETAALAPGQAEAVIAHELAHVVHFDWVKLLLARVATAIFWFNPWAWQLAREAHQLREEAADDAVIAAKIPGPAYAELLIRIVRHQNRGHLLQAVHGIVAPKNSLHRRVERILDRETSRTSPGKKLVAAGTIGTLGITAVLAALTIAPGMASPTPAAPVQARESTHRLAASLQGSPAAAPSAAKAIRVSSPENQIDADTLVSMRAAGISVEYMRAMKSAGFPNLTLNQGIALNDAGITPADARALLTVGMPANVNDLLSTRTLGLTPDYITAMRNLGITGTFADFKSTWMAGITPNVVRGYRVRGITVISTRQLVELNAVGADSAP